MMHSQSFHMDSPTLTSRGLKPQREHSVSPELSLYHFILSIFVVLPFSIPMPLHVPIPHSHSTFPFHILHSHFPPLPLPPLNPYPHPPFHIPIPTSQVALRSRLYSSPSLSSVWYNWSSSRLLTTLSSIPTHPNKRTRPSWSSLRCVVRS